MVFLYNKMSQAGLSEILLGKDQFGRIGFFVFKMFGRDSRSLVLSNSPPRVQMNKKAKAKALVFLYNKMSQAGLSEILLGKDQFGRIGFFVFKMFGRDSRSLVLSNSPPRVQMNKKAKAKALVFLYNKMSQAGLSEILLGKDQFGRIGFFVFKMFGLGLAKPCVEQFPP